MLALDERGNARNFCKRQKKYSYVAKEADKVGFVQMQAGRRYQG